jgi:hypothetical protein
VSTERGIWELQRGYKEDLAGRLGPALCRLYDEISEDKFFIDRLRAPVCVGNVTEYDKGSVT